MSRSRHDLGGIDERHAQEIAVNIDGGSRSLALGSGLKGSAEFLEPMLEGLREQVVSDRGQHAETHHHGGVAVGILQPELELNQAAGGRGRIEQIVSNQVDQMRVLGGGDGRHAARQVAHVSLGVAEFTASGRQVALVVGQVEGGGGGHRKSPAFENARVILADPGAKRQGCEYLLRAKSFCAIVTVQNTNIPPRVPTLGEFVNSMPFELKSDYAPAGDQPKAIELLTKGLQDGLGRQTLLGVTGSGKTFTMANVIQQVQKPTLVIAHNKTLAAQLCNEFREFFPNNIVEYFVSYYDYYQPEAYLPRTDTYIEKEATINQEIDRLRHAATQALLTRQDVIIVASVSCIYGLGSPREYENTVMHIAVPTGIGSAVSATVKRDDIMRRLIEMQFTRTTSDITRGQFRARGDVLEIMPVNEEVLYRIVLEGEHVHEIFRLDAITREMLERVQDIWLFPAKHFMTAPGDRERALRDMELELKTRLDELDQQGKLLEYERLSRRTRYDIEMIRNIGFCNGIENYSRHFDGRAAGEPPFSLLSYFPPGFLTVIDESHVTLPQIGGMFAGDQARKQTLVEHGFRLPSAKDNRPLKFEEFIANVGQVVMVSATPGPYEREVSDQIVEQIIRPTGLVDPETLVLPVTPAAALGEDLSMFGEVPADYPGQVKDIIARIKKRVAEGERALITTLTKKMAEDLAGYLKEDGMKVAYLHSDVETLDRITILSDLRRGVYDVLVGVNLLREGLDLPEVSLIGILDADKEGFLRSETSLIQTIGRAARNINGLVVLYADHMTGSLDRALKETARRRTLQLAHNEAHGITPVTINKKISDIRAMLGATAEVETKKILSIEISASPKELAEVIQEKQKEMKAAAANLMYETAAILRDEIVLLENELATKTGSPVPKKRRTGRRKAEANPGSGS
jgi:excinuclease ABC subunit B